MRGRSLVVLALLATGLAGCGSSSSSSSGSPSTTAAAATAASGTSLKGICPDNIVIQTDWFATPERAAAYQLIGPNGKIDASKGTYSGPLGTTGVNVEVRMGGPFIGFNPIPQQMYTDSSIFMGLVATDDAVGAYAKFPTKAVVAPLDINPQILMWDPATYKINTWSDVAASGAKILYIEGMPFMDYLVAKGYVKKDQLDSSFDGTPARFVAAGGKVIQQGYASNEPYRWQNDVDGWKKPVKYLLVNDAGYPIYPQGYAVKPDVITSKADCLKKLTPMIQQAQVDYAKTPGPVNDALVRIATAVNQGPPITAAANADAVKTMLDLKIISNGANAVLGDFDMNRVTQSIDAARPLFAANSQAVPASLQATDLVTNQFIDTSIHL
ncbi:MAG TPA: hypothetical protein VHT97_02905 [Acidimicrobiales bacterium]|nr:hypothetical protein [Acidimicrobiales bacterium]